jgi:hypothetical protein
MPFRTSVYDSIVEWLADRDWHEIRDLERLTRFPDDWLKELRRDPAFDVDAQRGKIRLHARSESLTA